MNCRRIQEMIPLYAGGDLERNRQELVSTHLRSCPECRDIAGQYSDSVEWFQSFRTPDFGGAFFDDLRQGVLGQIGQEESRPSFFQAIAERWRWNAVLAAAALLVILGGLLFYVYQRGLIRGPADRQMVNVPDQEEQPPPQERDVVAGPIQHQQTPKTPRPRRRALLKETIALMQPLQPDWGTELPSLSQREESEAPPPLEENPQPDESGMTTETTTETTTRIELETNDPNIRIIWFIPKDSTKLSNKRATDS